jgi:hypothetical protein
MIIKVMYQNGKIGEIENFQLDALIHSNTIKKFQRSGKWVTIGVDPTRAVREDYLEVPKRQKFLINAKKRK